MADDLKKAIRSRQARVGIIGLGYVGMPLALAAAEAGFPVVGLDTSRELLARLRKGMHESVDLDQRSLRKFIRDKAIRVTHQPEVIRDCDIVCICVPTPLTANQEPVLDYVKEASRVVASALGRRSRRQVLVILESTSFPGTTHDVVLPILERGGANLCREFHLVFSPERIDPGNKKWTLTNTPKLVGGERKCCTALGASFYRQFVQEVITLSSPAAAEMAKMLENVFRAVNIALANELWMMCDRMGLDVWEVIEAASTKPFGFMPFYPGPGLGGHCIPVDPFYLAYKAREFDFLSEFIELAGKINMNMPYFVLEMIARSLDKVHKSVRGSKVLVLGVSYKNDVGDTRNSPAIKIIQLLRTRGARVIYHDPHVPELPIEGGVMRSVALTAQLLAKVDLVLIHTAHTGVDYRMIEDCEALVVDTRNVLKRRG